MKVLFICDTLASGGAQKLLTDLLEVVNKKIECTVLSLSDKEDKYSKNINAWGIKVISISHEINTIGILKHIKEIILAGNYDLIHANLVHSIYYTAIVNIICKKKMPPLVLTEHSTDDKRRHWAIFKPIEKIVYSQYKEVISISNQTQNNLISWLHPRDIGKFKVIYNGINLDKFYNAKGYSRTNKDFDYQQDDFVLCLVGSFTPQKNHSTIIEVVKKLPSNYKCLFVGEGPLLGEIKEKVSEENLNDRIAFWGYRNDIPEIMHSVDLVLVPSLWEGFGLVAAEAMASRTAIVSSNVQGLSEVVSDCGIQVDPQDVNGFVDAIQKMKETEIREIYINKAVEQVKRFDVKEMANLYLDIYSSIIKR